ncbi:SRPBCC family protein [Deinococcus hopiensis]|uniref:Polyketide cyclase / dehydrase and lipid transport n=1 Tax=Deinococcus hopiensis KR-140 TaxID=695939 RepID=A0A1W1VA46_9DEIO|nr:SRPBCC family protein [Deinococcus hopiensis]SMB89911.1 Polyketide cyclase / dehydrase and lipid transport [Deinococcus hopiensis KR-140]
MSEDIRIKQSIVVRSRPDVLYRLALEPKRRVRWDPHLAVAEYEGGDGRLANNVLVRFKFTRRLLGLGFTAKYGQLQAPLRGGWESVRHVGPLEKLTQGWVFKAMPGGTEVTLTLNARIRYRWIRQPLERVLNNMVVTTLLELQRQVDAPGAQLVEDMGREMAQKQKEEQKAAKKAARGKR